MTTEAAQSLDNKIEALRQEIDEASARGQNIEVTFVITEEEATSKVMQLVSTDQVHLNIDYAQCHFINGMAQCFGTIDLMIRMNISVKADIKVKDGELDIKLESLHVGRLPVPGTLVQQMMRAVMSHYKERLDSIQVNLEEITIGDGELILKGRSK